MDVLVKVKCGGDRAGYACSRARRNIAMAGYTCIVTAVYYEYHEYEARHDGTTEVLRYTYHFWARKAW